MPLNSEELVGQSVGPFIVDKLIGEGGFAWVFAALMPSCSSTFRRRKPPRMKRSRTIDIPARWDFMYLIEVMDAAANGAIWPDLNERTPYIVVRLKR